MGMSIKNPEVEAMARELATARKVSMTEAMRQALTHELEREAEAKATAVARRKAILMETLERIWALPVLDDRSPDEILGYDENGLPT